MLNKLKIGILSEYPFLFIFGGMEVQCLETYLELKKITPGVSLIDYFDKNTDYNIIHFFGHPPGLKELYFFNAKKRKIILSTTLGAREFSHFKKFIRRGTADIASCLKEETNHGKYRYIFHNSDKIIVLNEHEKNFLHKFYDVQEEKIIIIPNGVDKRYFLAKGDIFIKKYDIKKFVLFVGNIIRRKNPLRLAQILKRISIPGVFIGGILPSESEYAKRFKELVDSCNNLLWIKRLPPNDPLLISAYAAATVFCLPSAEETQPISALEAMASGTPVILGDFAYAHQPPFEKALRCNISDENSIEKCIRQVFECRSDFVVHLSPDYTWENVAKKVLKVYKEVL